MSITSLVLLLLLLRLSGVGDGNVNRHSFKFFLIVVFDFLETLFCDELYPHPFPCTTSRNLVGVVVGGCWL